VHSPTRSPRRRRAAEPARSASVAAVEAAEALAGMMEDSSQIRRAVILDEAGAVLASSLAQPEGAESLARTARELIAAAAELHAKQDVTRVEVELSDGAVFVLREGGRTIAATTGASPTGGLVLYDLRTCLHRIAEANPKWRTTKKAAGT